MKENLEKQIDAIFANWDKTTSPGCALAVIKDGEIIHTRGYGMANLDYGIPNQADTVFYIASTSKQFAAAAIALLIEEGKLTLDQDIRQYIPELPVYQSPITVGHLVFHTSGVRDYLGLGFIAGYPQEEPITKAQALAMIARQKELNYAPGEEFSYTNSGYVLISILVERVTGKTLRQYTQEKIFKPLGMEHTHFHDDHQEIVPKRAIGYIPVESGYKILHPNFDLVGDGGLHTSVLDLFYWDQNFYQNRLGKGGPGFIEIIQTPGKLNDGKELEYAFGLFHSNYRGLKVVSHGGGYGGFRTQLMRFPEQKFSIILLCNRGDANPDTYCKQIADLVLEADFSEAAKTVNTDEAVSVVLQPEEVEKILGFYQSESGNLGVMELKTEEEGFKAEVMGQNIMLAAQDANHLKSKAGETIKLEIIFEPFEEGKPRRAQLIVMDGAMKDNLTSITVTPPTSSEMAEYVGTYFNAEIQAFHRIILKDDKMLLLANETPAGSLKPSNKDVFQCNMYKMTFARENGRIISYEINAGRVKKLHFVKQN
jgi:CubicO group peptidase (beta-lactamase class C family)